MSRKAKAREYASLATNIHTCTHICIYYIYIPARKKIYNSKGTRVKHAFSLTFLLQYNLTRRAFNKLVKYKQEFHMREYIKLRFIYLQLRSYMKTWFLYAEPRVTQLVLVTPIFQFVDCYQSYTKVCYM